VKVEVAILGFPSLIVLMVSVDVKYHERRRKAADGMRGEGGGGQGDIVVVADLAGLNAGPARLPECGQGTGVRFKSDLPLSVWNLHLEM